MQRAPRVCSQPGCANDVWDGKGRCPQHSHSNWRKYEMAERKKTGWNRMRRQAMRRDGGMCVFCGSAATHVDHHLPVAWGGKNSLANLQSMCDHCHAEKTRDEQRIGRTRDLDAIEAHLWKWRGING